MSGMLRKMLASVTAGLLPLLLLVGSTPANASDVKALTSYNNGGGPDYVVGFQLTGLGGGKPRATILGGEFTTQIWDHVPVIGPPSSTVKSFCVDLLHAVGGPPPRDVNLVSGTTLDQTAPDGTVLTRNIGQAAFLAAHFQTHTNLERAALQLAIWEILYDSDGNLNAGNFILASADAQVLSAAESYIAQALALGGGVSPSINAKVVQYVNGDSQDQVVIVPEPTSIAMVVGAIAILLTARVRRARSEQNI